MLNADSCRRSRSSLVNPAPRITHNSSGFSNRMPALPVALGSRPPPGPAEETPYSTLHISKYLFFCVPCMYLLTYRTIQHMPLSIPTPPEQAVLCSCRICCCCGAVLPPRGRTYCFLAEIRFAKLDRSPLAGLCLCSPGRQPALIM